MARGQFTITVGKNVKQFGVNLGGIDTNRKQGNALLRAMSDQVAKVLFRIHGPKTGFTITEARVDDQSFSLKGFVTKPMHGLDVPVNESVSELTTIDFTLPVKEEALESA